MISARRSVAATTMIAGAGLMFALAAPVAAAQSGNHSYAAPATAAGSGRCPTLVSKYVIATGTVTATNQVNVPGTLVNFVQGGTTAGCVVVSFSAEASADANTAMTVVAVLDGTVACQPNAPYFVRSNATATDLATRAMNFVCSGVMPGSHSIRMQFGNELGGSASVSLDYRTTIVSYVP